MIFVSSPAWRSIALAVVALSGLGYAQDDENRDGIPMLVRPGAPVPGEEEAIDPSDPQAAEKQRLLDWKKSLNEFAEALTEQQKVISRREQELAVLEAAVATAEDSLLAQESIFATRISKPAAVSLSEREDQLAEMERQLAEREAALEKEEAELVGRESDCSSEGNNARGSPLVWLETGRRFQGDTPW